MTEAIPSHPFNPLDSIRLSNRKLAAFSKLQAEFASGNGIESRVFDILFSYTPIASLCSDLKKRKRQLLSKGRNKWDTEKECFTLTTRRIWDMASYLSCCLLLDELARGCSFEQQEGLIVTSPIESVTLAYQIAKDRYCGEIKNMTPRGLLGEFSDDEKTINIAALLDYSITSNRESLVLSQTRYAYKYDTWCGMLYTPFKLHNRNHHPRLSSVETVTWGNSPQIIYVVAGGNAYPCSLPDSNGRIGENGEIIKESLFEIPIEFDRLNDVVAEVFNAFYPE